MPLFFEFNFSGLCYIPIIFESKQRSLFELSGIIPIETASFSAESAFATSIVLSSVERLRRRHRPRRHVMGAARAVVLVG